MGGVASCTRLRELLFNMATAAFQTLPAAFGGGDPDTPPRHLGQCTGWDFEGNGVKDTSRSSTGAARPIRSPPPHTTPQAKRASRLIHQAQAAIKNRANTKETAMRVQNKSIIVTGAGNGIGEGIAKRLAQEGAQVLVNDINTTGGQRVVAEVTAAGGKASVLPGRRDPVCPGPGHGGRGRAPVGKLDVVVNHAGWTHRNRPMLEVSEDELDKVYAINVKSTLPSAPSTPCLRCAVQVGAAPSTLPPPPGCGPAPA